MLPTATAKQTTLSMKQGKIHKPNNIHPLKTNKTITITEDLYNKLLNSNPIMETKDQNVLLLEQLKTELYTNKNITI